MIRNEREDARARLNVLSEIPQEWGKALNEWHELNRGTRTLVNSKLAPDRNEEYLFYQALLRCIWSEENLRDKDVFISRLRDYNA